jgi:RNA polymerase sigma-70 factor (ECF subfamily)
MPEEASFVDLIHRVRSGDQAAATELVRRYEPAIRRAARYRLADAGLVKILDSMDICQSVLASFFVRAAAGQYDLNTPEQLLKLLVTMARNKVASQARRERADRRDRRRTGRSDRDPAELVAVGSAPVEQLADRELLQTVYSRLSPEERVLVDLRHQGHDWQAIASRLGSTSAVLRKRLSRALDRITRQLGLEEPSDE